MSNMKEVFYNLGKHDAALLRVEAANLTPTEIINRELSIPAFNPENAAAHPGRPSELRALWGLCHTKNPDKAKAWVNPLGTSGMYMKDECYKDENGVVWRSLIDNNVYLASSYPMGWVEASL